MAQTTGGFDSYEAVGNRESLADIIYRVDREETPHLSMIGRGKAKATFEEWQTDALAAIDTDNAQLEGDDVSPSTSSPTTRIGNYCQISRKSWAITGTQEVVDKAGRKSEVAYQKTKRGLELRRDIEGIHTRTQGYNSGDATTARKARALESWITTNDARGSGGADATAATAAPTDATAGDMRTFTETILKDVIQKVYVSGARPKVLMVGPVNKQKVSDFTGRASSREMVARDRIQATASLYASDFGDLKVVPNVHQRERSAFIFDPEYAEIRYLRPIDSEDLAKIGDSDRGYMLAEWTLCMKNEKAYGIAADLLTT
tara:strand:+ start:884 stop:1834 length:951 start_codon:yes stop_codon:yes gene_type:complete